MADDLRAAGRHGAGDDYADPAHLRRNSDDYEALLALLADAAAWPAEALLHVIADVADCAFTRHPGRFADGALDNVLLRLGEGLERDPTSAAGRDGFRRHGAVRRSGRRHVLHVATAVQVVGGHTRTIRNWVKSDPASRHLLLLTDQGRYRLPGWLEAEVRAGGGEVFALPVAMPTGARAAFLREAARALADLVVLHSHGFDPVPNLAFAAADLPPVALVNHTDHLFWMGSSVVDLVVHQRHIGAALDDRRRVRAATVLPIPLSEPAGAPARDEARARLGIPREQTALLCVGRPSKFVPTRTHNFVRTARKLLDRNPAAHVYVAGVTADDLAGCPDVGGHGRLHLLGTVEDPSAYQAAADVYVEGFPFGSQTALLEAALAWAPVVRAFAPPLDLLVTQDESLDGLAETPADEAGYLAAAETLIRDPRPARELGGRLRESVRASHLDPGWAARLEATYARALGLSHAPRPLPAQPCVASARDVALAAYDYFHSRRAYAGGAEVDPVRATLLRAAYHARDVGDHRTALWLLRRCGRTRGWDGRLRVAVVKLLAHKVYRSARGGRPAARRGRPAQAASGRA